MKSKKIKPDLVAIKRALISVSDKDGIVDFAKALIKMGVEIISTGGTANVLKAAKIKVKDIADITKFPEMMDGRVKTLHPMVHGGILAVRDDKQHVKAMAQHKIGSIDLVVVNLYPFAATIAKTKDYATAIENIDIGGPSMVRSAAKNHRYVTVVTDVKDYGLIIDELTKNKSKISYKTRQQFALKAFQTTAAYDAAIQAWMTSQVKDAALFPEKLLVPATLQQVLRYGENPHQQAALYQTTGVGLPQAKQLQGKELSYNNLNDAAAALSLAQEFSEPAAVIIKHANPCGVAIAKTIEAAYDKALVSDPISAFGGIVAFNRKITVKLANDLKKKFLEVILAPAIDAAATKILSAKQDLRILILDKPQKDKSVQLKSIAGGLLLQTSDAMPQTYKQWKVVTQKKPTAQQLKEMDFAFRVAKHVKSNAIVFVKNGMTVGVGAGQMNRVGSAKIAIDHALEMADAAKETTSRVDGSVMASDAFLPFTDTLDIAAAAGAVAVVQPGGSKRDADVIQRADELGITMVFTNIRHFLH